MNRKTKRKKPIAIPTERERQRRKSAIRAAADRDIEGREVVNPKRRAACEFDDARWLREYLPEVFYHPFTADQLAIIGLVGESLAHGTAKCIAAPRGDGKSSITRYLILKYALFRQIRFGVIVCATDGKADESLKAIKAQLRRKKTPLWEDFPLETDVASYVGPAPARANNVTVDGRRVHVEWFQNRLILPTFTEHETAGPIITALGWESEQLQGLNILDIRPDFLVADDLDNRGSLAAADGLIAGKIEEIVDKTISGLSGPGRRLGEVMLCTITSTRSAAFRYSDPTIKPAWSGVRMPRIKVWPERADLWQTYSDLREDGKKTRVDPNDASSPAKDPFGREAFHFLESNFAEMHRGAVLSNEFDFIKELLPDGTPTHLSALQKCYDFISDWGMEAFLTEHQNAPSIDDQVTKSGISRELVQKRLSGLARRELPPGCKIAIGIDIGKIACHWVAGAFRDGGACNIIDMGIVEVCGAENTDRPELIQRAILRALLGFKDELASNPFRDADGNPVALSAVLIDSGYSPDAVQEFVRLSGEPFKPCKGMGGGRFQPGKPASDRRVGNHWFASLQSNRRWLYIPNVDHWKRAVHDRFIADPVDANGRANPGSLTLFIPAGRRDHHTFSAHIVAEEWVTEFVQGKGERARWVVHSANNHFLDATGLCLCGGEILGVGLFAQPPRKVVKMTFAQMAAAAKRKAS